MGLKESGIFWKLNSNLSPLFDMGLKESGIFWKRNSNLSPWFDMGLKESGIFWKRNSNLSPWFDKGNKKYNSLIWEEKTQEIWIFMHLVIKFESLIWLETQKS